MTKIHRELEGEVMNIHEFQSLTLVLYATQWNSATYASEGSCGGVA